MLTNLLDPRPAEIASRTPIQDSVNIPFAELPERMHELPGKLDEVRVVGEESDVREALSFLQERSRTAVWQPDFEYGFTPGTRLWRPNAFLEEVLPIIDGETALDLACGSGRDAVFLGMNGYRVRAIDHLADAIERGRDLQARYAPDSEIEWLSRDVTEGLDGSWDLITCFYFLDREVMRSLTAHLTPGGYLAVETFTEVHRSTCGKPRSPQRVLQMGELPNLFPGLQLMQFSEGWHAGRHTARLLVRK